jgi:hypothetical protein
VNWGAKGEKEKRRKEKSKKELKEGLPTRKLPATPFLRSWPARGEV